jgi:hypothetical protein
MQDSNLLEYNLGAQVIP